MFAGFLKLTDRCEACGLDFGPFNTADGPAFFAMSFVGIFVGFAALIVEVAYAWPVWVHMLVWLPLIVVLCLVLLRPIKGIMVAQQYRHNALDTHRDTP
jgi:uncharacterized protein (DUF983 family)